MQQEQSIMNTLKSEVEVQLEPLSMWLASLVQWFSNQDQDEEETDMKFIFTFKLLDFYLLTETEAKMLVHHRFNPQ